MITGASSGIGREMAVRFADVGATVRNADVDESPKDAGAECPTHELVDDRDGRAVFVETDVRDPASLPSVVERAGEFGGVDVFVNNAAIHATGSVLAVTEAEFDGVRETNVKGCFFGCQEVHGGGDRRSRHQMAGSGESYRRRSSIERWVI